YNGSAWVPPQGVVGCSLGYSGGVWSLWTANKLLYQFDSTGRWTWLYDRNAQVNGAALGYDGNGRLSTITGPNGRALTLSYDGNSRISSVSDGTGRSVSYAYDGNGDLST